MGAPGGWIRRADAIGSGQQPREIGWTRRALLAALTVIALLSTSVAAAFAAIAPLAVPGGPATVTTTVEFVSGEDLTTSITELSSTEPPPVGQPQIVWQRYALSIGYSCGSASPCEDVTITVDPQPVDEFYGTHRFAEYDSGTLPAGATLTDNSPTTGQTVALGDLAAGATGSFTLLYRYEDHYRGVPADQSFFLDGTTITNTVTIDGANAGATGTDSDFVTWHIGTEAPVVAIDAAGLARANTDYTYTVRMESDCMYSNLSGWGAFGEPSELCASAYSNVLQLPVGVTFVSATGGGLYDAGASTVSWSATGEPAATGWVSSSGWYGYARQVVVRFPDAMFADGCVIDVAAHFSTDVTYLDGQSKSAQTSVAHQATSCVPFASIEPFAKWSQIFGDPNLVWDQNTVGIFYLQVGNKANVPGVATVTDDELDQLEHLRIYRIDLPSGGTLHYTFTDGTGGSATTNFDVPADKTLASIEAISPPLPGPNLQEVSQPNVTRFQVRLRYVTIGEAPPEGWPVSNTASATMAYPDTDLDDVDAGTSTASIVIAQRPANFYAHQSSSFSAGGNPVAGQAVDYTISGTTSEMKPDKTIEPQYVFVAPHQWNLIPGSWSLEAGAPEGAIFTERTVTLDGQSRQALYVHWPTGTTWGMNTTWPRLHVQATPGAAPAGSVGVATGFIGDASHSFHGLTAYWGSGNNNGQRFTDAPDLDGDGDATEYYARVGTASYTVGAAAGLSSVKEICLANPEAPDGCDWIADSSRTVPVTPIATDITYRVTLRNNGNTALSNVVAYDVLPYEGDTGVSGGSAGTPRESEFAEVVGSVGGVSPSLALTFSASTDPCRPEVFPGGPVGCTDDWGDTAAGTVAIRAAVTGTLAPGAAVSFVYTAGVVGTPAAGEQACNSIAMAGSGAPVSEPSPVCVRVEAADLEVTSPAMITPQLGRPTTFPYSIRNVSGTTTEPTVSVAVPAGVEVTSLAVGDWSCTTESGTAPVAGPATLTCALAYPLAEGASAALDIPAIVRADGVSMTATVDGPLYDTAPSNDAATITTDAEPAAAGLTVAKDDGRTALVAGQETTYTISVANQLTTEAVGPVTVTDTLPVGVEFVSASDGGVHDGAGAVTWTLPSLAAAGDDQVTLTVRVAEDVTANAVINAVQASATDPAFPDETLTGSATDSDLIDRIALTKTLTFVSPADPNDPQPGDVVEYRFEVANTGGGTLTDVTITDALPGLSAIIFPDGWPSEEGSLAAGESVAGVATYTLTAEDIDAGGIRNTAWVTGSSAGGEDLSATSNWDQPLPAVGGLSFSKEAALDITEPVQAGDEVHYSFVAANTGNVTLHDVEIDDPMPGLLPLEYIWPDRAAPGVLAAGESVTATAVYVLTQADVDDGTVSNTATVSATAVDGAEVMAAADDFLSIPAAPAATFIKTGVLDGDAGNATAGDVVGYTFEIQNTGNVSISLLSIEDHLDGVSEVVFDEWPDAGTVGELAPGESVVATATYGLLQEDIDAGKLVNTATLIGVPDRGELIEESAEAVLALATEGSTDAPGPGPTDPPVLATTGAGLDPLLIGVAAVLLALGALLLVGAAIRPRRSAARDDQDETSQSTIWP